MRLAGASSRSAAGGLACPSASERKCAASSAVSHLPFVLSASVRHTYISALRDTTDARTLALAHAEISLLTSPGSHEESVDTSMSTSRRPYVGTAPSAVRAACSAFCSEASPEGGSTARMAARWLSADAESSLSRAHAPSRIASTLRWLSGFWSKNSRTRLAAVAQQAAARLGRTAGAPAALDKSSTSAT